MIASNMISSQGFYIGYRLMRERFYFFGSFRETAKAIEDSEARLEYLEAVIRHGLGDEEIEVSPLVNCLMVQTRFTLDKSHDISDSASERWKLGGAPKWNQNAKKNWEIIQKQANSSKNKLKQTKTSEVEEEVEYKRNIKEKNTYLEFVKLTDDEYNKLLAIFGKQKLDNEIQKLNNYIGSSGKNYKSHYYTIRKWNQDYINELEARKKETALPSNMDLLWTIQLRR